MNISNTKGGLVHAMCSNGPLHQVMIWRPTNSNVLNAHTLQMVFEAFKNMARTMKEIPISNMPPDTNILMPTPHLILLNMPAIQGKPHWLIPQMML